MSTEISLSKGSRAENRATEHGIDLKAEWTKQSEGLARRFAKELGLTTEEYIDTLSQFKPQPEFFKGIHGILVVPVIVETRIALPMMLDIVRITHIFDFQKTEDWTQGGFKTPSKPYTTWLTYIPTNKSVIEIRNDLLKQEDRRGGTVFDGIALYLRNPETLNRYFLDFPGSQVGPDYSPFLSASPNSVEEQPPHHPSLNYGSIESQSGKSAYVIASRV